MSVEIGNYLRQARESVGLSLDEVQEKTKIQKSFLEAIEKGDFDKLPSPFYVRTYLRSYANCVKVEPHYILREYRKKEQAERYQTGQFDVSQLTQQLNKLEQKTGMHKFGLTGTLPKVSQNTSPSVVNRTSAKTALTIAKPAAESSTGKIPSVQRRQQLEQVAKSKILSQNTNPERKFPSLLPSQALTTSSITSREKRQTTNENLLINQTKTDSRTAVERTVSNQKNISRLQKEETSPQVTVSQSAQFVPSRLTKTSTESRSLSRTQAFKKQTQPEKIVEYNEIEPHVEKKTQKIPLESRESNLLSRTSRFRSSSTLPTVSSKKSKQPTGSMAKFEVGNEKKINKENTLPKEMRFTRDTGSHKLAISEETSEVPTLRRSLVRNKPVKSDSFFTSRVIVASIVAVLLLGGVIWYLLSGSNGNNNAVQEKTPVPTPKSDQKQTAGPSSKVTNTSQTDTNNGDLKKVRTGLYNLTGTDTIEIVLKPKGTSWVQIRTGQAPTNDPKKYLKDVTLTSKDVTFKYKYTFEEVPDLYISIGSPDNIHVTVNGIPVASTNIIHIVKK